MIKLEVACNHIQSVETAINAGADRIELFENLADGGCTPSYGTIKISLEICRSANVPLFVLVRPRSGCFYYTEAEWQVIQTDLQILEELGVDGVVCGFLTADNQIDFNRLEWLKNHWSGRVTFHRAFDVFIQHQPEIEWKNAIKKITRFGVERILTSGGKPTAFEGVNTLKKLVQISENTLSIQPGSGVNSENAGYIIKNTGATEIHATAKKITTYQPVGSSSYFEADAFEIERIRESIDLIR
ncbi:MAG: copper homeostasis protein CutC [Bacteroidia bacterium]|nr:copper homeostasis protein CutC [Bacteroidia bacterium]